MGTCDLKTNPDLDDAFARVKGKLSNTPTPENFRDIYDFAKRLINQYGLGMRFIEKVYLLGYIDGVLRNKLS
jgi:hypothetical protein